MKWRGISPELCGKEGGGRNRQVLPQEKEGEVRRDSTLHNKPVHVKASIIMITLIEKRSSS